MALLIIQSWENKVSAGDQCFYGVLIQMFWRDHPPPHFHARYAGYKAQIAIETLDIIEGYLPPAALSLVREWGQQHRTELMENWELCAQNQPPHKIPPLP